MTGRPRSGPEHGLMVATARFFFAIVPATRGGMRADE